MHGIRRSGKTFILYDLFRRNSDAALYPDFEDDRLAGFTAADFQTVQDAFLELRPDKAGRIVYLFDEIQHVEEKQECDFIVKNGEGARFAALQVCRELTDENRLRETGGLIAACKSLRLTDGIILTDDQEREEEEEGVKIHVLPVWRWLIMDK
jgi:predicted AAA+ superfamily ATPase